MAEHPEVGWADLFRLAQSPYFQDIDRLRRAAGLLGLAAALPRPEIANGPPEQAHGGRSQPSIDSDLPANASIPTFECSITPATNPTGGDEEDENEDGANGWTTQPEIALDKPWEPSPPPAPLVPDHRVPTLLLDLIGVDCPDGDMDLDSLVKTLAERRVLDRLPRRSRRSLRRGAQVLICDSDPFLPLRSDFDQLESWIPAIAGADAEIWLCEEGPEDMVPLTPRADEGAYQFPGARTPVVVIGGPTDQRQKSAWDRFARLAEEHNCPIHHLSPFDASVLGIHGAARHLRLETAGGRGPKGNGVGDTIGAPDKADRNLCALWNQSPNAYRLAVLAGLATRVEPSLLRAVRHELCPAATAADEAHLWGSSLVYARTFELFEFTDRAQTALCHELRRHPVALEAAWKLLESRHAHYPDLLRIEEELRFRSTRDHEEDRRIIDDRLGQLAALSRTSSPNSTAYAGWVLRVMGSVSGRLAGLGQTRQLMRWAAGRLKRSARVPPMVAVELRLTDEAELLLRCRAAAESGGPAILVPDTGTITLEVARPPVEVHLRVGAEGWVAVRAEDKRHNYITAENGATWHFAKSLPAETIPATLVTESQTPEDWWLRGFPSYAQRSKRTFISYTSADKAYYEDLREHMAQLGEMFEGLDAPAADGGPKWAEQLEERVAKADVILILLSADYLASEACLREMNQALSRRSEKHPPIVIPVYLRPSRWQTPGFSPGLESLEAAHSKPLSLWRNRQRGVETVVREILERIKQIDEELLMREWAQMDNPDASEGTENSMAAEWESLLNPQLPEFDGHLVGREDIMAALERNQAVALVGVGGIGKTQIALAYCHRNRDTFKFRAWISADSESSVVDGLASLSVQFGIDGNDHQIAARKVLERLSKETGWLLVYDDARDYGSIIDWLPPETKGGMVLVTSRIVDWPRFNIIHVTGLDYVAARQLVSGAMAPLPAKGDRDDDISVLTRLMDGNPLLLEMGARLILLNSSSTRVILAAREEVGPRLCRFMLDWVARLHPGLGQVLRIACFFSPRPISADFLSKWINLFSGTESLPPSKDEILALVSAAPSLFSLADQSSSVVVAKPVRQFLLLFMPPDLARKAKSEAARSAIQYCHWALSPKGCEPRLDHPMAVLAAVERAPDIPQAEVVELFQAIARARYRLGQLEDAWTLLAEARHRLNEGDALKDAECALQQGAILLTQGYVHDASPGIERAVSVLANLQLTEASNLLGLLRLSQGRIAEGEHAFRQILQASPGVTHAELNLAVALWGRGNLEEAQMVLERAAFGLGAFGLVPPWISRAIHYNLGCLQIARGDWEKGVDTLETASRADQNIPKSVFIQAVRENNMGVAFIAAGRWADAEEHLLRAHLKADVLALPHHPVTRLIQSNRDRAEIAFSRHLSEPPRLRSNALKTLRPEWLLIEGELSYVALPLALDGDDWDTPAE
jgi:tetratricopeptide (TPR) repeat protein